MDNWIQRFRSAKTAQGFEKVVIPGDPEREMEKERREKGIPLLQPVIDDLTALGQKLDLHLTEPVS
jgi:LDH2 family malate/lactate/ureidoglycolate dehydrogenase